LNGLKTYTTDSNGQIKVSTKGLAPKAYTAKVTFNGNANYVASAKDIKVTVKKATPKMTAKKKTFKRTVKTKKYTIVLKDNTGKAMKKVKVTLKLKGKKTITAKTNSKGKATFKIKKLTKKGTYKTTVTFKGNKYYNKVAKKVKIKIK
jgi:5-hydroxyisourate hydrolase-like protein (transthyretin family)